MIDLLLEADTWRIGSAVVAVAVLFFLTVGLRLHGSSLSTPWRRVLRAVVAQQAVTAYVTISRAHATPPGFPEERVDVPLALIALSALSLLVCVLGVFGSHHGDAGRRNA